MKNLTQIEKRDVSQIVLKPHYILANRSRKYHIRLKLERNGRLVELKKYQEGDILYQLRYNIKKEFLKLYVYSIIKEEDILVAKKTDEYKICNINDIYFIPICESIKSEIFNFYRKHQ